MIRTIRGKALCVGDNIDTDRIYPSRYIELTEETAMAEHALEGIEASLPSRLGAYKILVAGRNFGCGSSREHAPRSLKSAGIQVILATSFARIFYRNAINLGLPAVTVDPRIVVHEGDDLIVDILLGTVSNLTRHTQHSCDAIKGFAADVLSSGGLVLHLQGGALNRNELAEPARNLRSRDP